jgi:hypothetical protein
MVLALVSGLSSTAQKGANESPLFASQAAPVFTGGSATSPDGRNVVSVRLLDDNADHFPSEVRVRTPSGTLTSKIQFGLNAEVLWSDDSRAFAVTGSQEGGNGQYHSDAFYIRSGRLVREPLTSLIERAFGHPVKCGWAESPNVVAVKWLDGSKRLLVAAQIINHSNCDSFGTFKGFVVNPDDPHVVKSYDQIEMKRLFGSDLGPWLQGAEDACIVTPRSCYVPTNHPELTSRP